MSKKTWILIACLVMSLAMGLGGSLAYLTDRDADVNVFTMGNVDIELTEDFNQGATLTPGVDITKDVKVKNVGKNDAWVWVQIALPAALDNSDPSKNVLHFNYAEESVGDGLWMWLESSDWTKVPTITMGEGEDAEDYKVYTVLYQTPLAYGEETEYSAMTKVYMDTRVDIDPDGQLYRVEKGVATKLDWNINENGTPYMYVSAYAIQVEGFDTVDDAYAAYTKQWTTEDGVNNGLIWGEANITVVSNVEELTAALAEGGEVVLNENIEATETLTLARGTALDGQGKSIDSEAKYAIKVVDGAIQNMTLKGSSVYGIYVTAAEDRSVIIDGVTVDGPGYTMNAQGGKNGGTLDVVNSHLNGWTSYTGFDSVNFINTYFNENSTNHWENKGYADYYDYLIKPYVTTTFEDCVFKMGFVVEMSAMHEGATLTFNHCFYLDADGVEQPLTAENINGALTFENYNESALTVTFETEGE